MQYFSKDFTKTHIKNKIKASGKDVIVHYKKNTAKAPVWMKIGKENKIAIMTKHWTDVLDSTLWEANQVVMFWFRSVSKKGVHLYVDKIEPGAFGLGTEKHWRILED